LTDGQSKAVLARLPLTADGLLTIPYRHRKTDWQRISAADILHHQADPAVLKGVMVLFGGTALGMGDVIATPLSPVAAGLEPHVEILSALLDNDFPIVPRAGIVIDGLLLLPFALLLAWALGRLRHPLQRAVLFPVWLLLCWGGTAAVAVWALEAHKLLLPLAPLLLFAPLALLLTVLAELHRAGSEHAGVLSLLGAYLPRPVAERLASLANRGSGPATLDASLDVTRREITVFFADIHGFAGITENASPDVVARLMQRVFTEMAESVAQQNGTIDKFIGDAIMAFWNAPDDDPQHAQHALAAAHDIRNRMTALASFCTELGVAPIDVGIGIESGPALVGNFGSLHRRTFTALGEPVVLASRLEGLTKQYQQAILIGEGCATLLGPQAVRNVGQVAIRGRHQALTMYVPA
jgi:adenylate cyclase